MARITTPFGFNTTADDIVAGVDLHHCRAIVTGGASGIGIHTARALAMAGADVTLAVRNTLAARVVGDEIIQAAGNGRVTILPLDLADLRSVAAFVAQWRGPLDILVNNAGVMALPEQRTGDGWEMQMATNHLGHFALAVGLHHALASARGSGARVVVVSSSAHLYSPVVFDDIDFNFRPYDPILAYGQSKTANVLFAVGAAARWSQDGIAANALMPGAIATGLQRHIGGIRTAADLRKSPAQGAATSVLLAASPLVSGVSGRYFEDCNEASIVAGRGDGLSGVAAYALDLENAERLWLESTRRIGAPR